MAGQPIEHIASVASFFVSRVDTLVDKQIEARIAQTRDAGQQTQLRHLLGTAAIANAKLAYERFRTIFGSERFSGSRRVAPACNGCYGPAPAPRIQPTGMCAMSRS